MNIRNLFRIGRYTALAVLFSACIWSLDASAHPSVNDINREMFQRIIELKKKAILIQANPHNYQLIQLFVMDKVNYVNFLRLNAPVVKILMQNFEINSKVDESSIAINQCLLNANAGMLTYAMEQQGYWDFDDIHELNIGCLDDVEIRHKSRYLNHHRWVHTYRPNMPPAPVVPAPKPPVPGPAHHPAHGNQNFHPQAPQHGPAPVPPKHNGPQTIHKVNPTPKPAQKPAPKPATKPMPKPAQKPGQQVPPPQPGQPGQLVPPPIPPKP